MSEDLKLRTYTGRRIRTDALDLDFPNQPAAFAFAGPLDGDVRQEALGRGHGDDAVGEAWRLTKALVVNGEAGLLVSDALGFDLLGLGLAA